MCLAHFSLSNYRLREFFAAAQQIRSMSFQADRGGEPSLSKEASCQMRQEQPH
jgi:hypothetical protein